LAEHRQSIADRQNLISAPGQNLEAPAEEGWRDEEVPPPFVLVFQGEAVVAKDEQALLSPAAAGGHPKDTETPGDLQGLDLHGLQHSPHMAVRPAMISHK